MSDNDWIGKRGELYFSLLITGKCDNQRWFEGDFEGAKAETKDFTVNLVEPTSTYAVFYVQVKGTTRGYSGKGAKRKLKAKVSKADVAKLKRQPGPTFVAGIDIETGVGYLYAITAKCGDTLNAIPCTHPIDCTLIKKLWSKVDRYWAKRNMLAKKSFLE